MAEIFGSSTMFWLMNFYSPRHILFCIFYYHRNRKRVGKKNWRRVSRVFVQKGLKSPRNWWWCLFQFLGYLCSASIRHAEILLEWMERMWKNVISYILLSLPSFSLTCTFHSSQLTPPPPPPPVFLPASLLLLDSNHDQRSTSVWVWRQLDWITSPLICNCFQIPRNDPAEGGK